jgi:hypothetical protein
MLLYPDAHEVSSAFCHVLEEALPLLCEQAVAHVLCQRSLDGELERAGTSGVVGLIRRFKGREQRPLLRRLLLWVWQVVEKGEVVDVIVLHLGLLHSLWFLDEHWVLLLLIVIVLEVEVIVLLGDVG